MNIASFLILAALSPGLTINPEGVVYAGLSDFDVQSQAEYEFTQGVKFRDDAAVARPFFHQAARAYDELWQRGHRSAELALNRARAHRLAGDLPGAIAAVHDGLAVARYERRLQVELEEARSAVPYPLDGVLAAECRPQPARTIGTRMSPAEAYLIAAVLWLLAWAGTVRFAMTRAPRWLLFAGTGLVCLAVLGGFWWYDWRQQRQENARPLVVVRRDTVLRRGNGDSFPARFDSRLPAGVEARVLSTRGGWVQVELARGSAGWLPEDSILGVR